MSGGALSDDEHVKGVLACDRGILARTITLVESSAARHQDQAHRILSRLLPHSGKAFRLAITGPPGVGKSTLIEALGKHVLDQGAKLAVLTIDPTSSRTGGSILGDKTRMAHLVADPRAFIRPSPTANALGGVSPRTRETMRLCEAAGYDVILVETTGVGQSELEAADLVDCVLVLLSPGGGDELQGIKRGLLEVADVLAVNKADGDNLALARRTASEYSAALTARASAIPKVQLVSGRTGSGIPDLWTLLLGFRQTQTESGAWEQRRRAQQSRWMWTLVRERLLTYLTTDQGVAKILPATQAEVEEGKLSPQAGADRILQAFGQDRKP